MATDNLVNADSVARTRAEAYHARRVVFQSVLSSETPSTIDANAGINSDLQTPTSPGVAVAEIVQNDAPIQKKYDPSNPKANSEGYVY
ncbi:flagellar basal body rod protein FlgC, partial [Escherichia coli]